MSVQARFFVQSITRHAHNPGAGQVKLAAASRGPENKTWATATPAGVIDMTISNPDAMAWFNDRLGKDVAITFEDRTVVCIECHREITIEDAYAGHGALTVGDGFKHNGCP